MSGTTESSLQPFNLETMSGVYPGTRTATFQRVRMYPVQTVDGEAAWFQLFWYSDPPGVVLTSYIPGHAGPSGQPLLHIDDPQPSSMHTQLAVAAQLHGWRLQTCGVCRWWRLLDIASADGVAVGHCAWPGQERPNSSQELAAQSSLSLDCLHWMPAAPVEVTQPNAEAYVSALPILRMPKAADLDPDRLPFWRRMRRRIRLRFHSWLGRPSPQAPLMERSGVGAGTEPCFVCQGRIANLGALAVETADGDKQTLSVWRCRNCYTLFANDWIDRWERLDNLETEETFYRISPAEAHRLLEMILSTIGGDHPARRKERAGLRDAILQLLSALPVLSHQVRQGR
jgi:hypothetical protein